MLIALFFPAYSKMEESTWLELARMAGCVDEDGNVVPSDGSTHEDVVVVMTAREAADRGGFPIYGVVPERPEPFRHEE